MTLDMVLDGTHLKGARLMAQNKFYLELFQAWKKLSPRVEFIEKDGVLQMIEVTFDVAGADPLPPIKSDPTIGERIAKLRDEGRRRKPEERLANAKQGA